MWFPGKVQFSPCLKKFKSIRFMGNLSNSKSRNIASFAPKQGTGLNPLLPTLTTEGGRDVLKQMLIYDPNHRIHVRRLSDHRYFQDYKDLEAHQRSMVHNNTSRPLVSASSSTIIQDLNNPALLSYLTNDHRRRKTAVKIKKKKPALKKETITIVQKRVISTPAHRSIRRIEEKRMPVEAVTRSLARLNASPPNGHVALKTSSSSALALAKKSVARPLIQMLMRVTGTKTNLQSNAAPKRLGNDLITNKRTYANKSKTPRMRATVLVKFHESGKARKIMEIWSSS